MLKFEAKKIIRTLEISDYAPEYAGQTLQVWVNPPMRWIDDHDRAVREGDNKTVLDCLSEVWSQGPEDTRVTPEDAEAISGMMQETDPAFFLWLRLRTMQMIAEHRAHVKKV